VLALKDINEVLQYNYDVCEVYDCDELAEKSVERDDSRDLEVCPGHYREIVYRFFI
jgi:hypothetical protein